MEHWKGAAFIDRCAVTSEKQCVGSLDRRRRAAPGGAKLLGIAQDQGCGIRLAVAHPISRSSRRYRNVLAAADIHCQPNSGPEPFGIAFIEALFAGLPVVTTRLGAPAEFIDSTCGVLVEPGNADALAEALRRLIDHSAERQQIGNGGPPRANDLCNVERQLCKLHEIIRSQIVGSDRSARTV